MKMTEKTKRYLAVGGGIVICAGLLAAIGLQFATPPAGKDEAKEKGAEQVAAGPGDVQGEPEIPGGENESAEGLVIQPETKQEAEETPEPARPTPTVPPEQSIQPEVEKPAQPEEETLTDPEKKPDGTEVEATPEPVDHDTYVPPADDGNSGGVLPGFDFVPDGGANTVIQADDMYENGNKIGSMD